MSDNHTNLAIAQALGRVRARIDAAAQLAGRPASEITLIAVSKTFPAQAVLDAVAAGQGDFGENRVEEALPKMKEIGERRLEIGDQKPEVRGQRSEAGGQTRQIRWHLIGHLQSRKVRDAVGHFDLIHSIDSVKLAAAIDQRIATLRVQSPISDPHATRPISNLKSLISNPQSILLECNISGEAAKSGFAVAGWERDDAVLDAFLRDVEKIIGLPGLRVCGLMTIAPIVAQPDQARPYFAGLRALRDVLRRQFPQAAWEHLSMGMTDDFEAAIAEGATLVRIGRAIFGERAAHPHD